MKFYASINGLAVVRARYSQGFDAECYDKNLLGEEFASAEEARAAALSLFPNEYYGDPATAIKVYAGADTDRPDSVRYRDL